MTPREIVTVLAASARLISRYERLQKRRHAASLPFVVEARVRIRQVLYLLARFEELESDFGRRYVEDLAPRLFKPGGSKPIRTS
jgi:hypothetical protein